MRLRDFMTPNVDIIAPTASLAAAARMMQDRNIGMLPVGENDRLVGSITDRDITVKGTAKGKNPEDLTVRDAMSEKIVYCFDDDTLEDAAQRMGEYKVRRIPVLNRDKRLVGIVSLGDMAAQGESKNFVSEALAAVSRD